MSPPTLATKFHIPSRRPTAMFRSHVVERLNEGLHRKLSLISAPAGFGKTTLVSGWLDSCKRSAAWLSLDRGDNDLGRFLTYLIAALQTIAANIGEGLMRVLQSPQIPPTESILTTLLNEISEFPDEFILVLDDFHVIDAEPVETALTFLIEHIPSQMHLVIITREDPNLHLARIRARDELTELRAADLRFTPSETAEFLNQVMDLNLSMEDIAALETRTEGWISGLQLAAISLQGHEDASSFIKSFTGSHRFVLDYLVEEVLNQQSESVYTFLLSTSILERMCGSLCDAVHLDPSAPGQNTLEYLERANLFVVPLDEERHWYRYHHLFADLLRQRLLQHSTKSELHVDRFNVDELHSRASVWYEENGLDLDAFHHAVAAHDVERATHLVKGNGVPLHFRGTISPVLDWLASLPETMLDAKPSLWVTYASASTMAGQPIHTVEEILRAAEAALQNASPDDETQDLIGHIAAIRAMLAIPQHKAETMIAQSRRALEFLEPGNLPVRTTATWTLGHAYQLMGEHVAAIQAYTDAISISEASGNVMVSIAATTCIGQVQEAQNQLHQAAESFRRVLQLAGDPPMPVACEAHLGLARVHYQWNNLDAAEHHGQQSLELAPMIQTIGTPASCMVFLAHLRLAHGDVAGASELLRNAEQFLLRHNFPDQMHKVAAAQVLTLLHQGGPATAASLTEKYELPICQARIHLAQGDPATALAVLEPLYHEAVVKNRADERLKLLVLQAIVLEAHNEKTKAVQLLREALAMAEPGGFVRVFVDEGPPMARLLLETLSHGFASGYTRRLLTACSHSELEVLSPTTQRSPISSAQSALVEPLSERELDVIRLISEGMSNQEIAHRLYLSLNTVKVHSRNIYGKLGVHNRMEAVARAQVLGILPSV